MRTKTALLAFAFALIAGCTSPYSDGWHPSERPAPNINRDTPKTVDDSTPVEKAPPKTSGLSDPVTALNRLFRDAYRDSRDEILATATPCALVLGDSVVFFRNYNRSEVPYTPALYHELKTVSHVPLTVFVILYKCECNDKNLAMLTKYRDATIAARESLKSRGYEEKTWKRQEAIFSTSLALMDRVIETKKVAPADLSAYCTTMTPLIMQNVYDATKAQLEGLNEAFTKWLAELTPEERKKFYVVVSGSHQARDKNCQMCYCRALLDEPGPIEKRLMFAESVFDEQGCRNTLCGHVLDEMASRAFFDDPARLQYDLLGDAACEIVPNLKLPK